MAGFSFADKVALVTGGSRGLGLAIARELCRNGTNVVLIARNAEELARAKTDLDRLGTQVLAVQCDLLDRDQIGSAIRQTIERFGRIDILVNNAGIMDVGPLEHMKREDFERAMDLHFWAPFELTMRTVPEMRKNGGGRIVNIASIGGKVVIPHMAPYSASKFALVGFSDALRAELARENIFVTTVTPGMMRTGSEGHAKFKGNHDAEFKWFALSTKLPLASISAERAVRKILAATRRGQSALIMPFSARLVIAANAIFPSLTGYLMKLVNRFLPAPAGSDEGGDQSRPGAALG